MYINNLITGSLTLGSGGSTPATMAETRIWWSSDESNYNDYLIEGALDCPALTEKGLMPEGSGEENPASWYNPPVKIEIGSAVTSIGDSVFSECSGLTSVAIPNSVTIIGWYAFGGCTGLRSVTIPNSVTSIGSSAFEGCTGLSSVTIPNSVTNIGGGAFGGCLNLENYEVDADNPAYMSDSGMLLTKDGKTLVAVPCKSTAVTISGSVTRIGSSAFYGCSGLTSVTIPNSVTSIGDYAFSGCSGLASVTIPNGVTSIGMAAFQSCSGLTSVTIPNSVTNIDSYAFGGCTGLTSVTIPDSVTSIGWYAFGGCTGLTSVTIPASVTSIEEGGFGSCLNMEYFEVDDGNPVYMSDSGMLLTKDGKTLVAVPCKSTAVTIPDSVTRIGSYAFSGCSGLTSVTIPDSVTSIGWYAFGGCTGLTSVTIGNGVTSIWELAFWGCSGLTSVTIPNSVTDIGPHAFQYCSGLTSVTIPNSVTDIGPRAFQYCRGLRSVTIGQTACDNFCYIFDESYSMSGPTNITDIVILDGVTSIRDYAFYGCSGLTSVTIPDSVTSIMSFAFYNCTGLTNVVFKGNAPNVDSTKFYSVGSACTAYVKKGSTGWGVEIPGTWKELKIQYMTPEIEWLADRNLVADMRAANGRTAAECYALGLDPVEATDDFRITSFSMAGDEPQVEWTPRTNRWTGTELNATVKGAESLEGPWTTVPSGGDPTFRFFKVEVTP